MEVCRYFGTRDRINHVHFRNVIVETPREKYKEVFIDEGQVDMFAVMKELIRQGYPRLIYPEHPRRLDADRDFKGIPPMYPAAGLTLDMRSMWATHERCCKRRRRAETGRICWPKFRNL